MKDVILKILIRNRISGHALRRTDSKGSAEKVTLEQLAEIIARGLEVTKDDEGS